MSIIPSLLLITGLTMFVQAAAMPMASSESQDFVYTYLTRVEREFGINQARVLANALQYKRELARKGAIAFGICPQYLPADEGPYLPRENSDNKVCHRFLGLDFLNME
jgi:hypothetical protein